ncbi:MAG: trehalase family glycosidase, partial [Pseudomonadaceae bacterium]
MIDIAPAFELAGMADSLTPAERYEELFVAVQMQRVFADSKTFVDCVPCREPQAILDDYRAQRDAADFDLGEFVRANFSPYELPPKAFVANPDDSLAAHSDRLWPVRTRQPREHPPFSSLLPLPHPYVVPGGRFTELYYWDSYFAMLGL